MESELNFPNKLFSWGSTIRVDERSKVIPMY